MNDSYQTFGELDGHRIVDLQQADRRLPGLANKPISIRLVVENLLRSEDGVSVTADDIRRVAEANPGDDTEIEIAFRPSRVLMQDYAGTPALSDLAAFRDKAAAAGMDPGNINPHVPSDLVIDHSLMVHFARSPEAYLQNLAREVSDNAERFAFLKWAEQAFEGLRVVPPGQGIIHQINLEYLAEVVTERSLHGNNWLIPDTVIGTDSHTTMVNGLGVLGWGVGGIEAEAVMLGEPVSMLVPPIVGVRLTGALPLGVLATDLALRLTEVLRAKGVVGAILEFFGPGVSQLSVADRATIANMSPEFGATCAIFPTDRMTVEYLRLTGRSDAQLALMEAYLKHNRLWFDPAAEPEFADSIDFDLSNVNRTVAGPKRPDESRALSEVPSTLPVPLKSGPSLTDGDIVIAAITSCTNTSNPAAMLAAGLLARNARQMGLSVPQRIKTSLAPGSRVVQDYLEKAGLLDDLSALGFDIVGFGCTTCVGNSGELDADLGAEVDAAELSVASVLSGNRNFEGRIHAKVKVNYLMSPPLVVAYALAGSVRCNLESEPLGTGTDGRPVMLADIWPDPAEIDALIANSIDKQQFEKRYAEVLNGDHGWRALDTAKGAQFDWAPESTYFQRPPFFDLPPLFTDGEKLLENARPLLLLGDHVTTDHISPVGGIGLDTPAAQYLQSHGVAQKDFNAYGARRGDHEVMVRGTFANPRLNNQLSDKTGGWTRIQPDGVEASVYEAAETYRERGEVCVVLAGKNYGAGSARDWAAKGTRLLGCAAVIAESFERIHRSNLVRMGVLPLQFADGWTLERCGIEPKDRFSIIEVLENLTPLKKLELTITRSNGDCLQVPLIARVDTLDELRYLRAGGILPSVVDRLLAEPARQQEAGI